MTRLALALSLLSSPALAATADTGRHEILMATVIWVVVLGLLGGVLAVMGRS